VKLGGGRGLGKLLIRLTINLVVPVVAYVLSRPRVHSDVTALVIGSAVPVVYTVGVMLWRRRLDVIGVCAIVCFAIGLLLVVATGGNELVFKVREEIWTGPLGLACLISVAVHRPLLFVALRLAARRNTQIAERIAEPQARRILTVSTAVIGLILLVHALAIVALAFTASTSTFLVVKRPISLAIVGGGLAGLVWWIRRQYTSRWTRLPRPEDARLTDSRPERQEDHVHHHDSQDGRNQRADRHGAESGAG